jgi:hypothetical protein
MVEDSFASSLHASQPVIKSCGVDQDDVLLFGCGVEEVARHCLDLKETTLRRPGGLDCASGLQDFRVIVLRRIH